MSKLNQASWDAQAQDYLARFGDENLYDDCLLQFAKSLTTANSRVLDLGCGPGIYARRLLDLNSSLQLVGLDFSENMIQLAKNRVPEAEFITGDIQTMSFPNQEFDGVFASFCVPYLNPADVEIMIGKLRKLLKQGGILYVGFLSLPMQIERTETSSNGFNMKMYYYDNDWIKSLLIQNGFAVSQNFEFTEQDQNMKKAQQLGILSSLRL